MSSAIQLRLPDGSTRQVAAGTTALDVVADIGSRLAKAAVAVQVDGEVVEVSRPLAAVVEKADRLLITLRPPKGLLGGLWEFPGGKRKPGESLEDCLKREIREELDIEITVEERLIAVPHAYTHFKITLHCFLCRVISGEIKTIGCEDYRWVTIDQLDEFAFPAADRKVIEALQLQRRSSIHESHSLRSD